MDSPTCLKCGAPNKAVPRPTEWTAESLCRYVEALGEGHAAECKRLMLKAVADGFQGIDYMR